MRWSRFSVIGVVALVVAIVLAACGGDDAATDEPAPGGAETVAEDEGAAAEGEAATVRIAVGPDPAYLPYFVAQEQGYFEEHGIEAELRRFSNGGDMNDAVIAGEMDLSGAGTGTLLPRLATGQEQIFAVTATSGTTFGFAAQNELQEPQDFVGKRLGMVPGTTSEYVWQFFLEEHGIARDEVEFVPAAPPELIPALERGEVDAFVVWEPWPTQAIRTIGEDQVHIWGRNEDVGYLLYFSFAGNREWMEQNSDTMVNVIDALEQSIEFINTNRDEAVAILADVIQLSEDETRPLVEDYDYELQMPEEELRVDVQQTAEWLQSIDRLDEAPAYEEVVNFSYLEQASG